jgi:protein-tyrosine-phosphatase
LFRVNDATVVRRLASLLRHLPDRWLHAGRRAALRRRLRVSRPASVLFVCHGNICRSPFAAALARQELARRGLAVRVASAGFFGPGRPSPRDAVDAARPHGVELAGHRSQLLTPALTAAADLVVVMDARQRAAAVEQFALRARDIVLLGDLDPEPIRHRAIRDPVDRSREVFDACYARLARCVGALVDAIADRA